MIIPTSWTVIDTTYDDDRIFVFAVDFCWGRNSDSDPFTFCHRAPRLSIVFFRLCVRFPIFENAVQLMVYIVLIRTTCPGSAIATATESIPTASTRHDRSWWMVAWAGIFFAVLNLWFCRKLALSIWKQINTRSGTQLVRQANSLAGYLSVSTFPGADKVRSLFPLEMRP